jgi:hypothetical protein
MRGPGHGQRGGILVTEIGGAVAGTAVLTAGIAILSASWRKRRGFKAHVLLGGWSLISGSFVLFGQMWGAEVGTFYALLLFSLVGFGIVAAGIELRQAHARSPREVALEPEDRPTNWPRGIAKSLLAIVLSGIASIGVGVAFALSMPMGVHDRVVIGGLLVPVLWGAGMAWTLSDAKLLRATIVLVSVSAVSYGVAFLPKALG